MKRIWIAISVIFILIVACITELISINKIIYDIQEKLNETKQLVSENDMESAIKSSNQLHEEWDKKHSILALFITHSRLEDIDQTVEIITANIESDEPSDFFSEEARLHAQLNHLKDTELPTINNIL